LPIGYSAADAAIVVTAATAATPLIIQVERCIEKLLFFSVNSVSNGEARPMRFAENADGCRRRPHVSPLPR
jgi:hypothetical protein